MRPLLVANHPYVFGGGEVGLRMLVEDLVAKGHEPVVAVPGATPLVGTGQERSIAPDLPSAAIALRELGADCDLVHVFSVKAALAAALSHAGKPIVMHALIPRPDPFDAVIASFAGLVVCNSQATARRFLPYGSPRIIYNGVRMPRPPTASLGLRPGATTVAIIGNVCPRKGQLDALPALDAVMAERDDVDLVLAGHVSGPIGLALQERAAASNRRIRVLGFVPDIADHMGQFALVLVPSRSEGFGRVAVEALRAGVPVLASRTEGLIEALAGLRDCWLPDRREDWPARIIAELDRPTHTREELLRAADRFDPERYTDEMLDAYREVVSG